MTLTDLRKEDEAIISEPAWLYMMWAYIYVIHIKQNLYNQDRWVYEHFTRTLVNLAVSWLIAPVVITDRAYSYPYNYYMIKKQPIIKIP